MIIHKTVNLFCGHCGPVWT